MLVDNGVSKGAETSFIEQGTRGRHSVSRNGCASDLRALKRLGFLLAKSYVVQKGSCTQTRCLQVHYITFIRWNYSNLYVTFT